MRTTPISRALLLLPLAPLALLAACGDDGASTPSDGAAPAGDATGAEVTINRSRFEPADVRIDAGATVTFGNEDGFAHTVTAGDDAPATFDSGEIAGGDTFEQEFAEPGTYAYFCAIHPTMRGTVTVA